jgi:hypothetical protein
MLAVESAPEFGIPIQNDVRGQYLLAMSADEETREAALKSIARYFPPEKSPTNRYYALIADVNLAKFYLDTNRVIQSYEMYSKLAELELTDPTNAAIFAPIGIAGQAMIHRLRGEEDELREKLGQVWPHLSTLDDETRDELRRLARELKIEDVLDKAEDVLDDAASDEADRPRDS